MTADEDTLLSVVIDWVASLACSGEATGVIDLEFPKKEKLGCGAPAA